MMSMARLRLCVVRLPFHHLMQIRIKHGIARAFGIVVIPFVGE